LTSDTGRAAFKFCWNQHPIQNEVLCECLATELVCHYSDFHKCHLLFVHTLFVYYFEELHLSFDVNVNFEQMMPMGVKHKEIGVIEILGLQMDQLMMVVNEQTFVDIS
jgi:hypothetical protein